MPFRIQSFEFCERADVPRWIRDSIVEILGMGLRTSHVFQPVAPVFMLFASWLVPTQVLDLGSGSGEPSALLIEELRRQGLAAPHFTLSDLLPNLPELRKTARRHPEQLKIIAESVDATAIPDQLNQPLLTIFNAFHHFPPPLAGKILAEAIQKQRTIFIMESSTRHLHNSWGLLPSLFRSYWQNPLRAEQDRFLKAFFSYVVPVIGICFIWDSLVSLARFYNEAEFRKLASDAGGNHYTWVYQELAYPALGRAVVFYGYPSPDMALC